MPSTWKNQARYTVAAAVWSAVCLVLITPASAWQFREVAPKQPVEKKKINRNLRLTRERFVPPIAKEVAPPAEQVQKHIQQAIETLEETPAKVVRPPADPEVETSNPDPVIEPQPEPEPSEPEVEETADPQPEPIELKPFEAFSKGSEDAPQAPGPGQVRSIHVAAFNNAEPGTTSVGELRRFWGEPAKTVNDGESEVLIYKVPSFRQVDVHLSDGIVSSMLIHLQEPLPVAQAAKELGLLDFVPVPVPDEFGKLLGQAYPERGILFSYTDDQPGVAVSQIMLEEISGEMFRLRAEHDFDHQYRRDLADLAEAIKRNVQDAHAHWLKAQILAATGQYASALDSALEAVRWAPEVGIYQLTKARLLALTGEYERAVRDTQTVINDPDTPAEIAACAEAQLGDLMVMGAKPDFQEAMKHHLRAIDLAAKVIDERRFAIRRLAKKVLVDAHLAIAMDIALGNFQRQNEVVPKWLMRATEIAEQFITQDNGDQTIRMDVYRTSLAAFGVLQSSFDASVATEEAIVEGRKLIASAADPIYQQCVERALSESLFHAVKLERSKGRLEEGVRYANNALALLRNIATDHASNEYDQYLEGQLNFLLGSLYAVQGEDHAVAVDWYAKALPNLTPPAVSLPWMETNNLGEIFVSMGVSYWANGAKEKAVRLTQRGADLMQTAIDNGTLAETSMAIPYGNLATMHDKLGHEQESREFAAMAAKLESVLQEEGTVRR